MFIETQHGLVNSRFIVLLTNVIQHDFSYQFSIKLSDGTFLEQIFETEREAKNAFRSVCSNLLANIG